MKLKIVHQNHTNRPGEEQVMTEEKLEMEQMENLQMLVPADDEPTKENSPSLVTPPDSASHPMLVSGKRKRKPKEVIEVFSPILRRRKRKSSASKSKDALHDSGRSLMSEGNASIGGSNTPAQLKSPTVIRAEEVQLSLGNDQPTILKALVRSHVASCFWMGLPVPFCRIHLPSKDTTVVLENENGEEFPIKYIAHKTGLSAGWRKFVAGNKLLEGDVLIFQLTGPLRFKVYVIRANDLTEVDGALSLLNLDSHIKQNDAGFLEGSTGTFSKKKKRPKSLPVTVVQDNNHEEGPLVPHRLQPEEQSVNDSDEVASEVEVLESAKFSESSYSLEDVKSFEEFHIVVNGVCIDSELSEHIRRNYYNLCCSKNAFLHDHLLPGLYRKLASSMIVETVHIANLIRGCKLTTPRKDFEVWEKSLRSFELLGLNVGFLRARLSHLVNVNLAFDSESALEVRRYAEAQNEQRYIKDEIQKLEVKLAELKELSKKYNRDIDSSKMKAESFEAKFHEVANAPW